MSAPGGPLIEVRDACKAYGAVQALRGVSFAIDAGEVLAILGDNGAGKSTVIKAISGVHRIDSGEIRVRGEASRLRSPADARRLGIETVYQDLALFDNLGIADNFFAGREPVHGAWLGPLGLVRRRAMAIRAEALLERLAVHIPDRQAPVGLMSGGQRQAVAVARASAFASSLVILDEPTAALGVRESAAVVELIRRLPAQGVAVILISHNLAEVTAVADRAIVLRRGEVVGEAAASEANHELLVSMIVGGRPSS